MKSKKISRRDFIKVASALSLSSLGITKLIPYGFLDESATGFRFSESAITNGLPNILILVFDSMSAYHLSLYGYKRETTPNISQFTDISTVYHNHFSAGNYTTPGTASLLTGLYPWHHRAINLYGSFATHLLATDVFSSFPNHFKCAFTQNHLATILLHDLRTNIDDFIQLSNAPVYGRMFSEEFLKEDLDLALLSEDVIRGTYDRPLGSSLILSTIDRYFHLLELSNLKDETHNNFMWVNFYLDETFEWLKTSIGSLQKPFLGYYHFYPPHAPYKPRNEFVNYFSDGWLPPRKEDHYFSEGHSFEDLVRYRQRYDEFIRYLDAELERVFDFLRNNGYLKNTYIIITSDHGELFERGVWRHLTPLLYEPVIKIPLIIHQPGQKSRQDVNINTSSIDMLPTLIRLTGQTVPDYLPGQILPLTNQDRRGSEREIYAFEAKESYKYGRITPYTLSLIFDRYKMIHYSGYPGYEDQYELYDLEDDPEEMNDLYQKDKELSSEMKERIRLKEQEINPS